MLVHHDGLPSRHCILGLSVYNVFIDSGVGTQKNILVGGGLNFHYKQINILRYVLK